MLKISPGRVRALVSRFPQARTIVVGDVMLDQFIRGRANRLSPEAPVPVVEFDSEELMPGGAANVARNLTALGAAVELVGVTGRDDAAPKLRHQLQAEAVGCNGLLADASRPTTTKMRVMAGQQQIVRLDREVVRPVEATVTRRLLQYLEQVLPGTDAVIIGDYGKGLVTQPLLDGIRERCQAAGRWVSVDPKPTNQLKLRGLSLLTPNRREAFALARMPDTTHHDDPLADAALAKVVEKLLAELAPAILLITLGELGLLLCRPGHRPVPIPTVTREVYDVSGAGDTVIAAFTLAICAGASPVEAAILANHAAGVVVGKRGTATVSAKELRASFQR